jgi:hypothetical protein
LGGGLTGLFATRLTPVARLPPTVRPCPVKKGQHSFSFSFPSQMVASCSSVTSMGVSGNLG